MQESCSYGSVGERQGNEPLYPENLSKIKHFMDRLSLVEQAKSLLSLTSPGWWTGRYCFSMIVKSCQITNSSPMQFFSL
jgi:hypothetical protein